MNRRKNIPGYTLIELIVSISILAFISVLFIANYRSNDQRSRVTGAANKLAADFRLVQSYALGAKKGRNGVIPLGGWCINFDAPRNYYTIFEDDDGNHKQQNSGSEDVLQINVDPKNILQIVGTKPSNPRKDYYEIYQGSTIVDQKKQVDVCYETPNPTVYITGYPGGGDVSGSSTYIKLIDTGTQQSKTIFVNDFGLIDVQ